MMNNDGEFTPDQVERQIDMLARAGQTWSDVSSDARLISDLSRASIENEAIAWRSWQRLAERVKSTEQSQVAWADHVQFRSPLNLVSGDTRELPAEQTGPQSREMTGREKRPRRKVVRLLQICAAVLVVAALVASMAIVTGTFHQKRTPPAEATPGTAHGASALYVSSPAGVYRVDLTSGKVVWHYADKSSLYSRPYVVDNVVIVADDSAGPTTDSETMVVGLDSFTGKPLWAKKIQETIVLTAGDGMILFLDEYRPASAPLPPLIAAYQATTGQRLWWYQPSSRPTRFQPFHQGTVANGKVYAVFGSQVFIFQASSGTLLWQKLFPNGLVFSSPVVSGTMLYFVGGRSGDAESLLFGINAVSGEVFQSQVPASGQEDVRGTIYSLTVIDGVVYVDVSVQAGAEIAYLYMYDASNGAFLGRYAQTPDTSFIYSRYPLHSVQHLIVSGMMKAGSTTEYDLVAFNTITKARAWSVPMEYPDYAADFLQVANDVIYLNVGTHLYAYSLSGKLLRDDVIPVPSFIQGPAYGPFFSVVA